MYVKNITSIHSENQVANLSKLLRRGINTNLLEQSAVILNRIILEVAEPCKMSHRNTEHKKIEYYLHYITNDLPHHGMMMNVIN